MWLLTHDLSEFTSPRLLRRQLMVDAPFAGVGGWDGHLPIIPFIGSWPHEFVNLR